jgi:hypothetical protein
MGACNESTTKRINNRCWLIFHDLKDEQMILEQCDESALERRKQ